MNIASPLVQVLVLLIAAVVLVSLFRRARLDAVLGYLIAGIAVGPQGLDLVRDLAATKALAELGVVFLLFTIGLELTIERLRLMSAAVYGLGLAQILATTAAVAGVGLAFGLSHGAAMLIGGAVALSSTAIVLPLLSAEGILNTRLGQTALAVLLLQDLAVGPLLVLREVLGTGNQDGLALALGLALLKTAAAIGIIVVVGRLVFRPLLRVVAEAETPELFVGVVLLVALGTAWTTEEAGLSMAFGAFLAGLLLAETEFRHQVAADIHPFRGLLLGLFFMTVGMGADLGLAAAQWPMVVGLTLALMVGKAAILAGLAVAFGEAPERALRLGGMLSQGGEFAFVLLAGAASSGLVASPLAQVLTVAVAISMALTPLVSRGGRRLLALADRRSAPRPDADDPALALTGHVVVVGFGEIGRIVGRMLKAHEIPYVVIDPSPRRVKDARTEGEPVFFGDATHAEVLSGVRAEQARAVIVTTDLVGVAEGVVAVQRHAFPHVPIVARAASERMTIVLRRAGAARVVQESTETGLKLYGALMDVCALDDEAAGAPS